MPKKEKNLSIKYSSFIAKKQKNDEREQRTDGTNRKQAIR